MAELTPRLNSKLTANVKDFWLKVYSYYVLFLAAACSEFANSVEAQLIFIVSSALILSVNNFSWPKDRTGILLTGCVTIITVLHYLMNGELIIGEIKFFLIVLLSYYMVHEFGTRIIRILTDCIYRLTILSIPLYLFQLLNPELFHSVFSAINFSFSSQAIEGGIYILVFNLNPWALTRNSGFMWEPGSFGAMLIFALVFEIVRNNFRLNKRATIMFLVAITTFSTATYIAILLIGTMLLIHRNRKRAYKIVFALPILVVIALQVYELPFIGEKLRFYYENNLDYRSIYVSNDFTGGISIGRFAGFIIEFDKMQNNPIVGTGWDDDYRALGIGSEWSNPNGLGVIIGRFGLSGIFLLLYGLYNFSAPIKSPVSTRIFVLVILLIPIFSNPFEVNIVFWMMVMYGVNHKNVVFLKTPTRHEKSPELAVKQ